MKNRNLIHSDNWATPDDFYNTLNSEFLFDYDPCPLNGSDGLINNWGDSNFINPPYSRSLKEAFVKKAIEESKKGKLCVMLLPVSTSTKLFHDHILPNATEIRYVRGRIKFRGINTKGEMVQNEASARPMHDSMIVIFGKPSLHIQNNTLKKQKSCKHNFQLALPYYIGEGYCCICGKSDY